MIITPFKRNWWILTGITVMCAVLMGSMNEKTVRTILWAAAIINAIYFYVYKYFLMHDEPYMKLMDDYGFDRPNPYGELFPLQFCNSAIFTLPLILLTGNRALIAYAALGLPVSTFLGVSFPCLGFAGYDLKEKRINGFYVTHYLPMFMALSLWTTGMYVPEYKDVLLFALCFIANIALAHIANLLIRKYTVYKKTNYFFTMSPDGNAGLEFFFKLIPYPFFYAFPAAGIFMVLYLVVIFIYKLIFLLI